jgi:histidine triad (HIT) family protein
VIAIKDLHPVAPVHILIIPKKEISSLQNMQPEDVFLVSEIVKVAQKLAIQFNIQEGYRLLTNNGKEAGQTIFHLHFHLIGGKNLGHMA